MKFVLSLALALLIPVAANAQTKQFEGVTVNVNGLGGVLDEVIEENVSRPLYEEYGIRVVTHPGSTMAALSTALASGSSVPYDVLMTDSLSLQLALQANIFDEITPASVPALPDIYDNLVEGRVDGRVYSVPFLISNMIIAYRKDELDKPTSLAELRDDKYAGKVGLYSFENSGGVMTLLALADANGGSIDDIDPGFDILKDIMPNVVATTASTVGLVQLLESGEISVAPLWNGRTMEMIDRGVPVDFSVQSEGLYAIMNHVGIVSGSQVKEAAALYIDRLISPETGAAIAAKLYYGSGNRKVELSDDIARKMVAYGEEAIHSLKIPDYAALSDKRAEWMALWNSELSR